jgi:hypothetical protein
MEGGQRVKNYPLYNERLTLINLETEENDSAIIQTYMPTSPTKMK